MLLWILFRFNFEDETPTTNFDTFPAAILTVFQVKQENKTLHMCAIMLSKWEQEHIDTMEK